MKIRLFLTATIMTALFFSGASEATAQTKKVKELEEQIKHLNDSIAKLNSQIDTLEEENLRYRIDLSLTLPEDDSLGLGKNGIEPDGCTTEVTDSLLEVWYTNQQAALAYSNEADIDGISFESDVPDEIYIERLKKMNSFIQIPYNDEVRKEIIRYSEKQKDLMSRILGRSKYYMPIFEEIFDSYGLPIELTAMAVIESSLNPTAKSQAGAKGMWQFMYHTAKMYDLHIDSFVDERYDPIKACHSAAQYLIDSYNMFGDWNLAIASYNCGAGNVRKAIKRAGGSRKFWDIWKHLPRETRSYVPQFVGALYTMEYHKEHGIQPAPTTLPVAVDTFTINRQLHLKQVSEFTGASIEELRNLNPQYRHDIIPGHEREYILRLPYQYSGAFIENEDTMYVHNAHIYFDPITLKKIKDAGDGEQIIYKVKNGDYLGKIASKHRVTVAQIKKWNKLKSDNIRVGQKLIIYPKGGASSVSVSSSSSSSTPAKQSASAPSGQKKITYTVKKGDVLGKIAEAHGVGLSKLRQWNNLKNDKIKVGQKLIIYTDGGPEVASASSSVSSATEYVTYTVKSGDSFYSIAKDYPGVSAQNIMDYNGISSSKLRPGMVIKIPKL